jgi:ABC-type lipoprotein release transport system permease subunit
VLSFFLFGVGTIDGFSLLIAPIALALIATLAAVAPIRRALTVDPMIVLRNQ